VLSGEEARYKPMLSVLPFLLSGRSHVYILTETASKSVSACRGVTTSLGGEAVNKRHIKDLIKNRGTKKMKKKGD